MPKKPGRILEKKAQNYSKFLLRRKGLTGEIKRTG